MEVTDFFIVKLGQQIISGIGKSACADTSYFRQSGDKMFLRKISHHSQLFRKKLSAFLEILNIFIHWGKRVHSPTLRHL